MANGKKTPESTCAEICALYKTGDYTHAKLATQFDLSTKTIENILNEHDAQKGELSETIREQAEKSIIEQYVDAGVPKERVLKAVGSLLGATRTVIVPSKETDPKTGQKEPGFADVVPDYVAINNGIDKYFKSTGGYVDQVQVSGPDGGPIQQETTLDLSNLSTSEKRKLLDLTEKAKKEDG